MREAVLKLTMDYKMTKHLLNNGTLNRSCTWLLVRTWHCYFISFNSEHPMAVSLAVYSEQSVRALPTLYIVPIVLPRRTELHTGRAERGSGILRSLSAAGRPPPVRPRAAAEQAGGGRPPPTATSTAEGRWGRQRHLQQRVGGEDRDIYSGG